MGNRVLFCAVEELYNCKEKALWLWWLLYRVSDLTYFKFSFGFETNRFWNISFSCRYIPDILSPWWEGLSWKELGRLRGESLPLFLQLMGCVQSPGKLWRNATSLLMGLTEEASQPAVKDWYRHNSIRLCHFPWTHSVSDHALWAAPATAVTGGPCHEQERAASLEQVAARHSNRRWGYCACAWAETNSLLMVQWHTKKGLTMQGICTEMDGSFSIAFTVTLVCKTKRLVAETESD